MGMAAAATKEWTYEMLDSLPDDGNRYEIIDGELFVTPPPAFGHQRAQWALGRLIANYLEQYPVGEGFFAPGDVIIDQRNVVEPDIFVVPRDLVQKATSWKDIKSLLLAVEILSPSTARADRHRKRLLYQRFNVSEYWIVDSDARVIDRWRPADSRAETLSEHIEWQPVIEHPPLRIDLAQFFARAHGEQL
jgi:Uma2 family endonuclease